MAASPAPVETKVKTATLGGALAAVVLWALDEYAFKAGTVPEAVALAVDVIVVTGVTFFSGYLAKHTPRPETPPTPPAGT